MTPIVIAIGVGLAAAMLWLAGALLLAGSRQAPLLGSAESPMDANGHGLMGWLRSLPRVGPPGKSGPGPERGADRPGWSRRVDTLVALCADPSAVWKQRQRLRRIREQLPDALDVMARALRAGHAVPASLAMVVEESADPLRREFALAVEDMRFGKSLPDALKGLAARVDAEEARFWVTCLLIQRETGGSLPQMLDEVSRLIRARMEFAAKVQAVSAEARFSAVVLAGLPVVLAGLIFLINPDYLSPLWTDPLGQGLAITALALMGCGVLVMRRMMRITI
ncbi:MAG: type II secretion system F family protein [Nitrospira sp.]|nr:type II secretion system F family protein [Nitrospira sp.]MCP9462599.1 type II secretion system F family protein [Nitrospira sp.]MCP9475920.1 type II secretion system F family protein [Nitrospira sp.]